VLAPRAPGLGGAGGFADLEDYRLTRLADLVVELADGLGLVRFDFVGWSWGASIGMHLAARHAGRLAALALLDAGHTDVQDVMEWTESSLEDRIAQYRAPSFGSWEDLIAVTREGATAWRPALEQRIRAGMEDQDGRIVARGDLMAVAAALHWTGVERPSTQLRGVAERRLPTLLVVATRNDTAAQVSRFRRAIPHAEVIEIDAEHDLLAHAPSETIRAVGDWLLEQPTARSS
jgi:pimeloyl-ACP methyl ester carboxylesterase